MMPCFQPTYIRMRYGAVKVLTDISTQNDYHNPCDLCRGLIKSHEFSYKATLNVVLINVIYKILVELL